MKLAISILRGNRANLRDIIESQTGNANWHSSQAKDARDKAAAYIRMAENSERSASKAAETRNTAQVELNQLDAAIAKLESE